MSLSGEPAERRDNGLSASSFIPVADVGLEVGRDLLGALGRAGIAAYLDPLGPTDRYRLFVADAERADARSVVESAARAAGADLTGSVPQPADDSADTNSAFAALIADWHVDTVAAVRDAERDLTLEDAEWRARLAPAPSPGDADAADGPDEHYQPPAPPPLPRLAAVTVRALLLIIASIAVLIFGGRFGFEPNLTFLLGVAGVLLGAGMLVTRLREQPHGDDDDGAIV
ncbi:MAG: hypothetical protein ABJB98_06470 [Actinomycetota bacterium]